MRKAKKTKHYESKGGKRVQKALESRSPAGAQLDNKIPATYETPTCHGYSYMPRTQHLRPGTSRKHSRRGS